jgi:hypothetical protein
VYAFFMSSMHALSLAHFNLLYLITLILFGKEYELWNSTCVLDLTRPQISHQDPLCGGFIFEAFPYTVSSWIKFWFFFL